MPAVSKAQQSFMNAVAKYKKGELPDASQEIKDAAEGMTSGEVDDFVDTDTEDLPDTVEEAEKKRDYAKEYQARKPYYYKKFQASDKAKKYRAELNKYNRDHGTYGNGDGKDASHKGGKIVGFEDQSKNRSRKEKSRLKKESLEIRIIRKIIRAELLEAMKPSEAYGYTKDGAVMYKGSKKNVTKKVKEAMKKSPESKFSIFMSAKVKVGDKYSVKNEIDLPANLHPRPHQQGVVGDMS